MTEPGSRYVAWWLSDDPLSWAPYDKHENRPIRPATLSQAAAEVLVERLNHARVDWIHDSDERRQGSLHWTQGDNDGHYPAESDVWVPYPVDGDDPKNREGWSWVTGYVGAQCGPDEWLIAVDDPRALESPDQDWVPTCLRNSSELCPRLPDDDCYPHPSQESKAASSGPWPVLYLTQNAIFTWEQHVPGGCRCVCQLYHDKTGACLYPAVPGLLLRVVSPADGIMPADITDPLPLCRSCYVAIAPLAETRPADDRDADKIKDGTEA